MESIQINIQNQIDILSSETIEGFPNRQGLRRVTGNLLEKSFIQLSAAINPDLSIEVGAHESSFSLEMKKNNPDIRSIAFEANPYVFEKYEVDLKSMNIEYENKAISEVNGEITFSIPTSLNGNKIHLSNAISSIHQRSNNNFTYQTITAQSIRLDSYISNQYHNIVLWIDVEGAQLNVINSANKIWKNISAVYIEVEKAEVWQGQNKDTEVNGLLKKLGFIEIMRDNLARVQYNSVYIKQTLLSLPKIIGIIHQYEEQLKSLITKSDTKESKI